MPLSEQLFSFQGRLRRKDYWISSIILWIAIGAFSVFVISVLTRSVGNTPAGAQTSATEFLAANVTLLLIFFGVWLIALWPSMAIGVKRCHDRDKSGWWMLLWFVLSMIPYLGILAWAWQFIELGFIDGTQGSNRFGPSPKGIGSDSVRLGNVFE
jgi:uncharacterized membrane protein YhaH (DUF805 family)